MKESNPRTDAAQKRLFRQRKCLTLFVCAALVCLFFGAYALLTNALAHDVAGQAYTLPRSPAAPAAAVVMKIDPATTYKDPGETFSVTVRIENVVDFGAFQFELTYDSAVVTATNVTGGTFLGSTGRSVHEVGPTYGIKSVAYGAYTLGDGDGPNGSGILAAITFQATSVGTSTLHLQDILATDTDGTTLFPTANDGEVIVGDVYPPPLVTSISPPWGYSGTVVEDVIVEGEDFQEDASVQLTRTGESPILASFVTVQSSTRISCTLNLGRAATGQWNVVVTNPDDQSGTLLNGFTIEAAPPPPTVNSITPNSGNNNEVVHITNLAGSNFLTTGTTSVMLLKTGETNINATGVTVESTSKITCYLDLRGESSGKWTVRVTNPDAQYAELANGFTVNGLVYLPIVLKNY